MAEGGMRYAVRVYRDLQGSDLPDGVTLPDTVPEGFAFRVSFPNGLELSLSCFVSTCYAEGLLDGG